jgi:hypothetical protein
MSSRSWNGGSPPQAKSTDAGDAEADSMIGRFGCVARKPWTAAVRFLALLLLVLAPGVSLAKPYVLEEGPAQEGDPTADDQPSPSPKGNKSASISGRQSLITQDGVRVQRDRHVRLAWQAYLRLIARFTIR